MTTKYQNPSNVPTRGNQTYAALGPITPKQLRWLSWAKRTTGNQPTWEADCRRILGDDWDGELTTLSQAAGSWLIYVLQRGMVAVSQDPEDLRAVPQ